MIENNLISIDREIFCSIRDGLMEDLPREDKMQRLIFWDNLIKIPTGV
jgi:hypothetical protein